jgi:hypothetical protein
MEAVFSFKEGACFHWNLYSCLKLCLLLVIRHLDTRKRCLKLKYTLRNISEQALKIYLPRRFNSAFKDEDITNVAGPVTVKKKITPLHIRVLHVF